MGKKQTAIEDTRAAMDYCVFSATSTGRKSGFAESSRIPGLMESKYLRLFPVFHAFVMRRFFVAFVFSQISFVPNLESEKEKKNASDSFRSCPFPSVPGKSGVDFFRPKAAGIGYMLHERRCRRCGWRGRRGKIGFQLVTIGSFH